MILTCLVACNNQPQNPTPEHIHSFGEWSVTKNPTCTEDGTKTRYCDCGEKQSETIPATGEEEKEENGDTADVITVEDGYLVVNGVKTEYKIDDGKEPEVKEDVIEVIDGYLVVNGVKTEYKVSDCNHVWETVTTNPTCTAGGYDTMTCKLCDKKVVTNETAKLDHTYGTSYSFNNTYHWYACSDCGLAKNKGEHLVKDDGMCSVCGNPMGATEGIIYEISDDETYAIVVAYEGNATKIKIAEEYNGLPVKNINKGAFRSNQNITSVIISDSVTSIDKEAFQYCHSLISVIIGDGVTSIGSYAFDSCSSLTSVIIGNSVTSIGNYAFYRCSSLTSIVIPDSVTSIGIDAFFECTSLSSVVIGNGVATINYNMFNSCTSLTSIVIPDSVTAIGSSAFSHCSSLTSIVIPDSVTAIGSSAFTWSGLTSVVIPDSVTFIDESAFNSCTKLTSVTIGDGITSIGDRVFYNCYNLTSLVISNSVTAIGSYSFYNCYNLTSIVIPDSVTSIGSSAFGYCSVLTDVYYTGSEEEWNKITIDSGNYYLTDATIHFGYVPEN